MPYSEKLADDVRLALKGKRSLVENKMFGGLCFMWRGNMLCGVSDSSLLARVSPDDYPTLVNSPGVGPMLMKGKHLKSFVLLSEKMSKSKPTLRTWLGYCEQFCKTLPKKE